MAFHIGHIARSIDRLLTYAEERALNSGQLALLKSELDPGATREQLFSELNRVLKTGTDRIRSFSPENLCDRRTVGRQQMPTTLAGLLVHIADHTQRHVGQAISSAKIVKAAGSAANRLGPDGIKGTAPKITPGPSAARTSCAGRTTFSPS